MMDPIIKSMHSPDVELQEWQPASLEDVCFLLQMEIGPAGEEGADVFDVMVATPEGLRRLQRQGEMFISKRALFVVAHYSVDELLRSLAELVASCDGESWVQCVQKLQRYFQWEYDDYVPAKGSDRELVSRHHETTVVHEVEGLECHEFLAIASEDLTAVETMFIRLGPSWHCFSLEEGSLRWEEVPDLSIEDYLEEGDPLVDLADLLQSRGAAVSEVRMETDRLTIAFSNGAGLELSTWVEAPARVVSVRRGRKTM